MKKFSYRGLEIYEQPKKHYTHKMIYVIYDKNKIISNMLNPYVANSYDSAINYIDKKIAESVKQ